jgi:hypothetical protein
MKARYAMTVVALALLAAATLYDVFAGQQHKALKFSPEMTIEKARRSLVMMKSLRRGASSDSIIG